MEIVSGGYVVRYMVAGSGGGNKGDVAVESSNKAVKGADGVSAATVLGLFLEDVSENEIAKIAVPEKGALIRAPYTGSGKTSVSDSDIGKAFDLDDETSIDLDDTSGSGGALCIVQGYDNDNETVDFVFAEAAMYW